jgi:hypothetical protein
MTRAVVPGRRVRVLLWLPGIPALALVWASCIGPEPIVGGPGAPGPYCETTQDCIEQDLTGTECVGNSCFCTKVPDVLYRPCCKKGTVQPDGRCYRGCHFSVLECIEEEEDGGAGGDAAGSGGGPAVEVSECSSPADCPGPPDARCGSATCVEGRCGLEIEPGELPSQVRGDCKTWFCDIDGSVILLDRPDDIPNDGKQCTADVCVDGAPKSLPILNGLGCPESNFGVCFDGECVECEGTLKVNTCKNNKVCSYKSCVPPTCEDLEPFPNGTETDVNCGGACISCQPGYNCLIGDDCLSGVCKGYKCQVPTCTDGVKNGSETGLDCGSPSCGACPDGEGCAEAADCLSGVCWAAECMAPTCLDAVLNGDEIGIDCGESCGLCP